VELTHGAAETINELYNYLMSVPAPKDFEREVRFALQLVCLFGAIGFFLGSTMVNNVSPEEARYNSETLPWMGAYLAFLFAAGFLKQVNSRLFNILSIGGAGVLLSFLVYSRLFVVPFIGDFRLQLDPISFWIPLVIIASYAFLDRKLASFIGVSYSLVVMSIVYCYLKNENLLTPSGLAFQSWLQHYVLGLPAFVAALYVLSLFKEKLYEARLREKELLAEAHTDQLTKINNRRGLDILIANAIANLSRNSLPFTAILIDLDHFKRINDIHGHATGDEVLKIAARVISKNLRQSEWCGRWGGEEFFIGIHANLDAALQAAERFRASIAKTRGTNVPAITASFGVAEARPGESAESVLARADKALYAAKNAGRNSVRASLSDEDESRNLA
jgi:diguanylate cyclase (GGDEF)-like protein